MKPIANTAPETTPQPLSAVSRHRRPGAEPPRFAFALLGEHKAMGPGHYLMLLRQQHGRPNRVPVRFETRVGSY